MEHVYLVNIYNIIGCGIPNCLFLLYLTSYKEVKRWFWNSKHLKKYQSEKTST